MIYNRVTIKYIIIKEIYLIFTIETDIEMRTEKLKIIVSD